MANDTTKKGEKENEGRKQPANYNFDEAVLKVQEWNEALKCERLHFCLAILLLVFSSFEAYKIAKSLWC